MAITRTWRCRWFFFLGLVLSACECGRLEGGLPRAGAAEIDVTPRGVALVPPGTIVGDRAPPGWTHLVIKSRPRVGADSLGHVSQVTARLAATLFTAILADVRAYRQPTGEVRFLLANVAVGVGTKVRGEDMVLSSDTQAKLGANLGFLEGQVLAGGEKQTQQMRCVARSHTMAILDVAGVMLRDKRHCRMTLRYALLVDPATGRLSTLAWLMDRGDDKRRPEPFTAVQLLAPNMLEDCVLHVDPKEFVLGVPTAMAFAIVQAPPGQAVVEFPENLKAIAAQPQFTAATAEGLEWSLRSVLPSGARQ